MSSRFGTIDPATKAKILGDKPKRKAAPNVELVEQSCGGTFDCVWWIIPLVTASEVNGRDWHKRSKRTNAAWKAVSKAFGPVIWRLEGAAKTYHCGERIDVRLIRLGGKKLDRSNLPTALKAVEDAIAFFLGADDGDPRWHAEWEQKPGGPCGVIIEITC